MKLQVVIVATLVSIALGAPQQFQRPQQFHARADFNVPQQRHWAVLRDERQDDGNGFFNYLFETENGINTNALGRPGLQGQSNIEGAFSFPLPDGSLAQYRYIADEFGYRPESALIPTPHPLPAHAIEQIRIAEEQRARGITWDSRGRRITK